MTLSLQLEDGPSSSMSNQWNNFSGREEGKKSTKLHTIRGEGKSNRSLPLPRKKKFGQTRCYKVARDKERRLFSFVDEREGGERRKGDGG